VLLALVVILAVARIASAVIERFRQPAVLGESLGGVLLGNQLLFTPDCNFVESLQVAVMKKNWALAFDSLAICIA
jgi:Kef-type K+ transport system membrane component KefB